MNRLFPLLLLALGGAATAQTWAGDLKPYEVKDTRLCSALRVFAPEKASFFRAYRISLPAFLAKDIVQIAINKNGFKTGLSGDQSYVDFRDAGDGQGFLKKTYTSENRFITAYLDPFDRYITEICLIGN